MASPSDNPLKRLIHEIHRRSLLQVLRIYIFASWAVLQVVDTLGGALRLPEWLEPMALVLLIIGLPIVLATAFVQEGGPRRVAGDVEVPAPPGGAAGLFNWRNAFGGGVLAFALLGFVGTGWILFGGGLRPALIEQSIAVLPFDDLSPEGDQQYFVEGLSEEIINALSQIADLKVAARTSTFILAEENANIEMVANALGVANVLEGSVRKSGNQVRITAQLIEAESGFHLWSETFDRELTDIFQVQDEIARAITDQLQVTLAGGEQTRLVAEATESTEAHEAYLRGRYFWNQRTEASLRSAIAEFQRAVDLDPSYAEAYSGLADSYLLVDVYNLSLEGLDYRTNLELGLIAARRAVSLAPTLGMAHTSLGWGLWHIGEWESAGQEFELAIALSPAYATAHYQYGVSLYSTGRANEAVTHAERGLELDPVSQIITQNLGWALWSAGRIEDAIEEYRETIQLAPGWSFGWYQLAVALLYIGDYDEGLEAWVNDWRLTNRDVQVAREVYEAMIRYRETGEPQTFSEFDAGLSGLVWLYAQTGQPDRAIDLFEEYYVGQGAYGMAAFQDVLSFSDALGDDPRYQALLEEAGITW